MSEGCGRSKKGELYLLISGLCCVSERMRKMKTREMLQDKARESPTNF